MSIPEAIVAAYRGRITQVELAKQIGVSQGNISDWGYRTDGKLVAWLDQLAQVESLSDRPRGWILVQAGYVEQGTSVGEAIAMDPRLTDENRESLMKVYDGYLAAADDAADGSDVRAEGT